MYENNYQLLADIWLEWYGLDIDNIRQYLDYKHEAYEIKKSLSIKQLKAFVEFTSGNTYHLWNDDATNESDLYIGFNEDQYKEYLKAKKELEAKNKSNNIDKRSNSQQCEERGELMKNYEFKKLTTNIVQNLLNEGYGIKDFELFVEEHDQKLYFASFSNSKPGLDDFGSGDTKKFITTTSRELGFKEEWDRDGCDIADNGKLIDHQSLYKLFTKSMKKSALKEVDGYPKTALLIEGGDKDKNVTRWILAPSLKLGKNYFARYPQTKHFKRIKVLDWAQDVTKGGGYEQNYDKSWKKEIAQIHTKSNARVLGKE